LSASADVDAIRARLSDEVGTLVVDAPESVAFVYPSPYHTGMSSLGYQTLYRAINQRPGRAAHRAFLPDDVAEARRTRAPLLTYEALRPVSSYSVFALSVAYELELAGVVECLELSGFPPLAAERDARHPIVLAGGPLTFSNPLPLAPFVDVILMGEADETVHQALDIIFSAGDRDRVLREIADRIPSAHVPSLHGDQMPPVEKADSEHLPAYSQILTPHTELREMFLVEPERGCHRGCEYCVMRRSTNDGMRTFDIDKVLSLVPERARRVGLVGAAVTDHPRIADLVEALADTGLDVGLSSLRADRLNDRLCTALRRGGQTVLTTASDGASQRLRNLIQRRAPESVLVEAAQFARAHGFKRLKLYMMLGLPGEEDDDVAELIDFSVRLSKIVPLSLGIAPFVAKRNTPLDGAEFAGIKVVDKRLDILRKGVRGKVDVRGTSARWAWVEYVLAQGGQAEGRAVLDAVHRGGAFRDWKDAFDAMPADRPTRALVRPGNKLGRVLQVLG
jgi:radical SAM superfamily enzyme YgiQ (UPF0313 family)